MPEKILVCGAGGYVGRHLVASLAKQGAEVFAVSRKLIPEQPGVKWLCGDLFDPDFCRFACEKITHVYNLAATVGGIGFIGDHKAECLSSAAININLLRALEPGTKYFFASSSCVYPSQSAPLKEDEIYPGQLTGYALEKYFSEQTALAFRDKCINVRIARLHTVYGPDDFRGSGRDHFPTAMAEQVVQAVRTNVPEIKIWGDGNQTRSLLYIDDAVEGIQKIMGSGIDHGVLNLASSEVVSVNSVVAALEDIAAIKLRRFYCRDAAVGMQNKTADTTRLRNALGWEPMTPARVGLERLYRSAWDRALKS
jgi:GDP-D-mannose 3',5'-epimerase